MLIFFYLQHSALNFLDSNILQVSIPLSQQITTIQTSAVWDDCTQSIYYIDYFATKNQPSIFRYDYNEDKKYSAYFDGQSRPIFIIPARECKPDRKLFIIGVNQYAGLIEWDGKSSRVKVIGPLLDIADDDRSGAIAFAQQNENGHFFFSTSNTKFCGRRANSSLFSYSVENGVKHLAGGFAMTTGLAFHSGKIYHIDSCKRIIIEFHTDSTGNICKRIL